VGLLSRDRQAQAWGPECGCHCAVTPGNVPFWQHQPCAVQRGFKVWPQAASRLAHCICALCLSLSLQPTPVRSCLLQLAFSYQMMGFYRNSSFCSLRSIVSPLPYLLLLPSLPWIKRKDDPFLPSVKTKNLCFFLKREVWLY